MHIGAQGAEQPPHTQVTRAVYRLDALGYIVSQALKQAAVKSLLKQSS